MEKTNIAEILKDCPKGMELDCTMYEDVYLNHADETGTIYCYIQHETHTTLITFNKYGGYNSNEKSKCVIFPKGKTTWEGFHRPFEDGDILVYKNKYNVKYTFIYKRRIDMHYLLQYCGWFSEKPQFSEQFKATEKKMPLYENEDIKFATEEEKQKFFDVIKANGYKWDSEAKILVKFVKPKFNVGDIIQNKNLYRVKITEVNIDDECYGYESILYKGIGGITFNEQDEWSLVSDKFDINTLVPFKSKVLVKPEINSFWMPSFFGFYNKDASLPFICCNGFAYKYCIPYEDNEHLLGNTTDCNEYFKTWKE